MKIYLFCSGISINKEAAQALHSQEYSCLRCALNEVEDAELEVVPDAGINYQYVQEKVAEAMRSVKDNYDRIFIENSYPFQSLSHWFDETGIKYVLKPIKNYPQLLNWEEKEAALPFLKKKCGKDSGLENLRELVLA